MLPHEQLALDAILTALRRLDRPAQMRVLDRVADVLHLTPLDRTSELVARNPAANCSPPSVPARYMGGCTDIGGVRGNED